MVPRTRRLLIIPFAVGVAFYVSATLMGIYFSMRSGGSPPGLSLDYTGQIREHVKKGEYDKAIPEAEMAVALDHATGHIAHQALGAALAQMDRTDEAIEQFRQALSMQANYADGHFGLAMALARKAERAMADGDDAEALNSLAEAIGHFQQTVRLHNRHPTAPAHLNKAIELYATALTTHGRDLSRGGQHRQAIAHYRQAIQANPRDAQPYNYLAEVLATHPDGGIRDGRAALQYAQQARDLTKGQHPVALQTLAAAYAEAGRFDDAVKTAQVAINLAAASSAERPGLADRIRLQLELYRKRQAFRRPDWDNAD